MPAQPYRPPLRLSLALLALLTGLAALLRLPQLSADSLWFDEAQTWSQVSGSFFAMLSSTMSDNYPPLYNIVTWCFVQALGEAEWVLRLPAALFGIALVPMVYLLGSRASGRTAGLLAALLIALSAFHIWYSLEARMYSLLALTACAFAWAALRDLDLPSRGSGRALVGIGLALLLSHPYGALDWFSVCGAMLVFGHDRRRMLRLFAITLAVYLPFGLFLVGHAVEITGRGFWLPEPQPSYVVQQFANVTSGLLPGILLCAAAALVPRGDRPLRAALTLLSLIVVPVVLACLASLLTRPIVLDRYLIGALPALVVLAAMGVTRWLPGRWSLLSVATVATVASCLSLVHAAPPHRQDWRGVAAYLADRVRPEDCVVVRPAYNTRSWRYYNRDTPCVTGKLADAIERPTLRNLFLIVETNHSENGAEDIATIEATRPLLATRQFHRLTLSEFGRSAP